LRRTPLTPQLKWGEWNNMRIELPKNEVKK
jgi:hypothetical protein